MAGKKNKGKKKGEAEGKPAGPYVKNRKAWHNSHIHEKLECGMVLFGTEVKSIREGGAKIDEAYVRIDNGELYLVGANFSAYKNGAVSQHDPGRKRKLLVHRRQIAKLLIHVRQKGRTMVPLALYFHHGRAKLEIGIAEGKQTHDKRHALRKKQQDRDIKRAIRR